MTTTGGVRTRGRGRRAAGAALAACLLAAVSGCGGEASAGPPLTHSYGSPEALAKGVLDAIAADDAEAMERILVTREEHRELLWPQLPESDDMPFGGAWQMSEASSRKARRNVLASFGGTRFELVSLEFTRPPERYDGFTVHFGADLRVRRPSDGRVGGLDVLDVVVERDGRWKALDFDDD